LSVSIDYDQLIPIFPLPNTVLMPRAILPLHIFEPRYRDMAYDALRGRKLIAIALLKPDYESDYHTLKAEVYPYVCLGRIVKSETLPDGRYNILLEGVDRAQIKTENHERSYRRGSLSPVCCEPPPQPIIAEARREIERLATCKALRDLAKQANWLSIFECAKISLSDIVDLLAYSALPEAEDRIRFLGEPCVVKRSAIILDLLSSLSDHYEKKASTRNWPPPICEN